MQSLRVLTIVNLVGAGLTIAFAIAFGIGNFLPIIHGEPVTFNNIPSWAYYRGDGVWDHLDNIKRRTDG